MKSRILWAYVRFSDRLFRIILVTVSLGMLFPSRVLTQDTEPALDDQISMLLKVIDSEVHLGTGRSSCDVGILFSHHDSSSITEKDRIIQLAAREPYILTDSIPVHCIPIDLAHTDAWRTALASDSVAAVIVTSVDQRYLAPVSTVCRERSILSMTTVPKFVQDGMSVGVTEVNDRTMLLINLPVSRSEGARFSSRVLKMAKILR